MQKMVCFPWTYHHWNIEAKIYFELTRLTPKKALSQLCPSSPNIAKVIYRWLWDYHHDFKIRSIILVAVLKMPKLKASYAKHSWAIDGVHYEFQMVYFLASNELVEFEFEGKTIPFGAKLLISKTSTTVLNLPRCSERIFKTGYDLPKRKVDLIFNPSASPILRWEKTQERKSDRQ